MRKWLWPFLLLLIITQGTWLASDLVSNLGIVVLAKEDTAQAHDLFFQARSMYVSKEEPRWGLGQMAYARNDWTQVSTWMGEVAANNDYHDVAAFYQGQALWRLREQTAARAAWQQASRSNYRFPLWLQANRQWGLETTGLSQPDYDALVAELTRSALESGHKNVWLYVNLGKYYTSISEYEKAIAWFQLGDQESTGRWPDEPAAQLAIVYTQLEQYEQARAWWHTALEKSLWARPEYLFTIGELYEMEGGIEQALRYYHAALEMDPVNAVFRENVKRLIQSLDSQDQDNDKK